MIDTSKIQNMKHHDTNYTKMRVGDDIKLKVIFTIDNLRPHFVGTVYASELRGLRRKYIYKDISFDELKLDVEWLKNIKKILKEP